MEKQKRSADEIRRIIEEFKSSGLTRGAFCQQHDIAVTTFDYWRGAQARQQRLVEVEVAASEPAQGFKLVLVNGRHIESSWRFAEAELIRLIRIAERA